MKGRIDVPRPLQFDPKVSSIFMVNYPVRTATISFVFATTLARHRTPEKKGPLYQSSF